MVASECFRKVGRRIIENPHRTDDGEINPDYNKREKQVLKILYRILRRYISKLVLC